MIKSIHADLVEEFDVSSCTIYINPNTLFIPLKYGSMKHLWGLIQNVDIKK